MPKESPVGTAKVYVKTKIPDGGLDVAPHYPPSKGTGQKVEIKAEKRRK